MSERKAFQIDCKGPTCGTRIWMVPKTKRDGSMGWGPMDLDEEDPEAVPEEWDQSRSHYNTCPDADTFHK